MSNLTKLAAMSLVRVWPVVVLTSAGLHGTLQLDVHVSELFWSGCFSSPEQFGAVVFKHSPILPTLIILHSTDLINVDGCLEWGLMAGLWGFSSRGALFYLGAGWTQWRPLDAPGTHPPFKCSSGYSGVSIHIPGETLL